MGLSNDSLLQRCCYLFYSRNMRMQDIASYLGISRFRVGRYIKEAQERGAIRVEFHDPNIEYEKLAVRLESELPVRRALVTPTPYDGDIHAIRSAVGQAGALFLQDMDPDGTLGITWGRSVAYLIDSLPSSGVKAKRVVELAGGIGMINAEVPARAVALKGAEKLHAECVQMPAPIIADSIEASQTLTRESSIRRTLDIASHATVAVVGVGAIDRTSMLYESRYISDEDLALLRKRGAVGSIIGRFFDTNGVECDEQFRLRAVAVPMDVFLRIPERVILASGMHKTDSIVGVAKAGLATTVVTDSQTAIAVLDTIHDSAIGREVNRKEQMSS